jgi:prepilin-type processing-associated H-X9-DG protein
VRTFLAAFERADLRSAAACVKGVKMSPAQLDALAREVRKEPMTMSLSEAKTTVSGDSAAVAGKLTVKPGGARKPETLDTQVNLVSSGGAWLIVPNAARAQQDRNPDMVNAFAWVLTEPKVLERAKGAAESAVCLSNVKQLCTAALMLSQDYDEVYKLNASTFTKSLTPYVRNASVFTCPAAAGAAYSFNGNLAGVRAVKIHAPAQTVMIYEGKNGKLDFRHNGRASVGFADGHAKWVNAQDAKNLRWKP